MTIKWIVCSVIDRRKRQECVALVLGAALFGIWLGSHLLAWAARAGFGARVLAMLD